MNKSSGTTNIIPGYIQNFFTVFKLSELDVSNLACVYFPAINSIIRDVARSENMGKLCAPGMCPS